jgi:tetratricopeptide (TPR) repeat protein
MGMHWRWNSGRSVLGCLFLALQMLHAQSTQGRVASSAMEREFQAAMAAEDKGELDRAEILLGELHSKHPGIFAVDESLGLLYVAREQFAKALPLLEAAVREQPSSDVAHVNLGAAYYKLHRNPEALREFERAAKLNPGSATTQQALGQLWMEAQQPQRAAEAFAAALDQKPGDPDLLLNQAMALEAAGESSQAAAILGSLPRANESAAAQSRLGEIDEKAGAYQQAAQHFTRAVELDPSEANVWSLGVEFLRHWTFDAAIREFEAAAAKFPDSARMRLGLGAAYFGNGSYAKAVPVFAGLLEGDPANSLYAELLGLSCTAVMQEAKPRCSTLLSYAQAHPGDARASTYAAAALVDGAATEDRMALARKLLESALAADPKLAEAQFEMGMLKQNQADWAGSIANLEAAVALKPDYAQAHYRLALAYWRSGRKQEGQAEMELQKKYARQQQHDLDQRLRQITTFLVDVRN